MSLRLHAQQIKFDRSEVVLTVFQTSRQTNRRPVTHLVPFVPPPSLSLATPTMADNPNPVIHAQSSQPAQRANGLTGAADDWWRDPLVHAQASAFGGETASLDAHPADSEERIDAEEIYGAWRGSHC